MESTSRKSEQEKDLGSLGYEVFEDFAAYERWSLECEQREWTERLSHLLDRRPLPRSKSSQASREAEAAIDECFAHLRIISFAIEALDS